MNSNALIDLLKQFRGLGHDGTVDDAIGIVIVSAKRQQKIDAGLCPECHTKRINIPGGSGSVCPKGHGRLFPKVRKQAL